MTMLLTSPCTEVGDLHVGDQIFRRYYVRDEDGVLTNSTVTATLTLPDESVVNLTVTPEATGTYLVTFGPFTVRGIHAWKVQAAGPVYRVDKGTLRIKP